MKKIILFLLIIMVGFILFACNNNTNKPIDNTLDETEVNPKEENPKENPGEDNPGEDNPEDKPKEDNPQEDSKEEPKIERVKFCDECFNRSFKVSEFNISLFSLIIYYDDETEEEVTVTLDMITKVNGNDVTNKDNLFTEIGDYEIVITYLTFEVTHTFNLYETYLIEFYVDGELYDTRTVNSNEVLTDIPELPILDDEIIYWEVEDFSNINSDMKVNAIIKEDYNKILSKANSDLIVKYLDVFNEEINSDITLDDEINGCSITWYSNNSDVISETGKYHMPYKATTITLKAVLTYKDSEITKECSFNVNPKSYRSLDRALSTGYLYRNYDKMSSDMFKYVDIYYCAFLNFDTDGNITNTSFLDKLARLIIPKAHAEGAYVIPSLVGSGSSSSTFTTLSQNPTARANLAKNLVNAINKYNLDGIDFDWETPTESNKAYFTLLCKDVYEAVKKNNPHHLVTAAIGGGKWQPPRYDLPNSHQYLDYINLMCYSMVSTGGYYQNALYASSSYNNSTYKLGRTMVSCSIDESVKIYNDYGIPNSKIIPGLAYYAIKQVKTDGSFSKGSSILYDSFASNYLKNSNYDYYFDEKAKVPYLLSKDGETFISYDDEKSILEKAKYVKEKGLAGLMNWEIGCDTKCVLLKSQWDALQ